MLVSAFRCPLVGKEPESGPWVLTSPLEAFAQIIRKITTCCDLVACRIAFTRFDEGPYYLKYAATFHSTEYPSLGVPFNFSELCCQKWTRCWSDPPSVGSLRVRIYLVAPFLQWFQLAFNFPMRQICLHIPAIYPKLQHRNMEVDPGWISVLNWEE